MMSDPIFPNELLQLIIEEVALETTRLYRRTPEDQIAVETLGNLALVNRYLAERSRDYRFSTVILTSPQDSFHNDDHLAKSLEDAAAIFHANPALMPRVRELGIVLRSTPDPPDFVEVVAFFLKTALNLDSFWARSSKGRNFSRLDEELQNGLYQCIVSNSLKAVSIRGIDLPETFFKILPDTLETLTTLNSGHNVQSSAVSSFSSFALDKARPSTMEVEVDHNAPALMRPPDFYKHLKSLTIEARADIGDSMRVAQHAIQMASNTIQDLRFHYTGIWPPKYDAGHVFQGIELPKLKRLALSIPFVVFSLEHFPCPMNLAHYFTRFLSSHYTPTFSQISELELTFDWGIMQNLLLEKYQSSEFREPRKLVDRDLHHLSVIDESLYNQGLLTFPQLERLVIKVMPRHWHHRGERIPAPIVEALNAIGPPLARDLESCFIKMPERVETVFDVVNPDGMLSRTIGSLVSH